MINSFFRIRSLKIWSVLINVAVWLICTFWGYAINKISILIYAVWFVVLVIFIMSMVFEISRVMKIRNMGSWYLLYILTLFFVICKHVFEYARYDFGWQSRNYKYIAQLVESHRLDDNPEDGIKLPDGYAHLSEDGYISADQTSGVTRIEFVIDPGLMFSYEAITYISNDDPPEKCISASVGRFEKIEVNWYKYKCLDP